MSALSVLSDVIDPGILPLQNSCLTQHPEGKQETYQKYFEGQFYNAFVHSLINLWRLSVELSQ